MAGRERLKRSTADRMVSEFMERVGAINSDDRYLYRFDRLVLFGSYVNTDREKIGDIDIGFSLVPKWEGDVQRVMEYAKSEECRVHDEFVRLIWPREEVLRAARNRNGYISLHPIDGDSEAVFSAKTVELEIPAYKATPCPRPLPCPLCSHMPVLAHEGGDSEEGLSEGFTAFCPDCLEPFDGFSNESYVGAIVEWNQNVMLYSRCGSEEGPVGHACLTGDTHVLTSKGWTCIRDIEVGDCVYSHDGGFHRVVASGCTGSKATLTLNVGGLAPVRCTEDHPFRRVNADGSLEWVRAGELAEGDVLRSISCDSKDGKPLFETLKLVSCVPNCIQERVYSMTVERAETYYIQGGLETHNCNDMAIAGAVQ